MRSLPCSKRSGGTPASRTSAFPFTSACKARAMPAWQPVICRAPNSRPAWPTCAADAAQANFVHIQHDTTRMQVLGQQFGLVIEDVVEGPLGHALAHLGIIYEHRVI